VTRLRDSIKHGTAASQQAALQALQQFTDNSADVAAARVCIMQQPFVTAALRQLLGMRGTQLPVRTAKMLALLAQDSQQAAEQIAAQPGMLAGLARMLQPSSAQGWDQVGKCACLAINQIISYCTVCERAAADPHLLSGLVALLLAADSSAAATAVAPAVLDVLRSFARSRAAGALQMVQQPGAVAALANVLSSQHTYLIQGRVVSLVQEVLNPEYAPITAQIVQHLQQSPQLIENMLLIATKKRLFAAVGGDSSLLGVALHSVLRIVQHDPEAAKQIAALPAAVTGLFKCPDNKEPIIRALAAKIINKVTKGDVPASACLLLLLSACLELSLHKPPSKCSTYLCAQSMRRFIPLRMMMIMLHAIAPVNAVVKLCACVGVCTSHPLQVVVMHLRRQRAAMNPC
jgi:hypothetical protein